MQKSWTDVGYAEKNDNKKKCSQQGIQIPHLFIF